MTRPLDVICLGRAAVDLYGLQIGGRLEDMQSFAKYIGGSSANVAAGLARLGRRSSMLTRVGNEHMGRFVREELQRIGVDVSHVRTDAARLTAFVILGIAGENSYPHIFFRENCADMNVEADDFDASYIASSRALAITGTHLSTPQSAAAVAEAARLARESGTRIVFDIDYRPVLWGLATAGEGDNRFVASRRVTEAMRPLLAGCSLIVGTEEEICIAGGSDSVLDALRAIREHSQACIVVKRGATGCVIVPAAIPASVDAAIVVKGFPVEVLNTLGAGDAFLAGFLHGWLDDAPWERCGMLGNACGALVVSRHGCAPALPSAPELQEYLQRASEVTRPDLDDRIQHIHVATTTRRKRDELYVLAFDHRRQLEQLARGTAAPAARIECFKGLIATAVERIAERCGTPDRIGVIVDDRYGSSVLSRMSAARRWIGRAIEIPASRPLEFDPRSDTGLPLTSWPATHVIKCLVFYHPDDPIELRLAQEERIVELSRNALALERELLLEVIASSRGQPVDEDTLPRILRRFYNLGVRPAWWKLEPQMPATWERLSKVIAECDPYCNGVLLLGLDAPESTLRTGFEHAAPFEICRGFAVGRSIFGEAARDWLSGRIDDERAIALVADRYERLIRLWQDLRATKGRAWPRSA
jgi:5-dehydro-2-deoxygluconokinase